MPTSPRGPFVACAAIGVHRDSREDEGSMLQRPFHDRCFAGKILRILASRPNLIFSIWMLTSFTPLSIHPLAMGS